MRYKIARISLHPWEEPPISGSRGSGTVFFSGCALRCVFCQNHTISQGDCSGEFLEEGELLDYFFRLEEAGAHNLNLVSPSHYALPLSRTLREAKRRGLGLPVVWNSSGADRVAALRALEGLVDVYLPDFKFFSARSAARYCALPDYVARALAALDEMHRQQPRPIFEAGLMKRGLLVRHLLLPGRVFESKRLLRYLHARYGDAIYLSLMSQYLPLHRAEEFPELRRRVLPLEYGKLVDYAAELGIVQAYVQALAEEEAAEETGAAAEPDRGAGAGASAAEPDRGAAEAGERRRRSAGRTPDFQSAWRLPRGICREDAPER